ncbi:MAG: hypothetical protein AAF655_26675 [Bacteroidota bacterium]
MNRIIILLLVFPSLCFSQSDEINISATFKQSLELRIVGGANIDFTFSTTSQYQKGYATTDPSIEKVQFEIASSTNFQVDVIHTEFTDGTGNTLDANYFFYRVKYLNATADVGSRFKYTGGVEIGSVEAQRSHVHFLDGNVTTILEPGPDGNAGDFEDNRYQIHLGCGSAVTRGVTELPSLLDANITPGTYTATLTLTAIPVIL